MQSRSRVVVLRTAPESIFEDYGTLFAQAGLRDCFKTNRPLSVIAETGLDSFFPAATITPWQIEGILDFIRSSKREMGKTKFFVRGPQGFLAKARLENYIGAVADRLESNLATPSLTASEAIEGNHVVVLGNLRTHLVHAVGGTVLNVAEFLRHAGKRWALLTTDEQIIVRYRHLKNSAAGVFGVMDGTFAGDGAGPRALRVFVKNYILASHDLVALDAVAAKMMGFDPLSIPYLRRLHEDGLGCADPGSIEVDGIDINGIDFRFHTLASPQSRLLSRIAGEDRLKHTNTGRFGRLRTSFLEALQDFYIRKMWQNRTGKYRLALAHSSSWGRLMDKYNLTLPNQLTQDNR